MVETPAGACVSVLSVSPRDGTSTATLSNVDAYQDLCDIDAGGGQTQQVPEPFTDHAVALTISNEEPLYVRGRPDLGPSVTFDQYEVSFSANDCPSGDCPILGGFQIVGPTLTVRPDTTAEVTVPLVPIRTKDEFRADSAPGDYSSYTATIEASGRDAEGSVLLRAHVEFSIGNFDNCRGSTGGLF